MVPMHFQSFSRRSDINDLQMTLDTNMRSSCGLWGWGEKVARVYTQWWSVLGQNKKPRVVRCELQSKSNTNSKAKEVGRGDVEENDEKKENERGKDKEERGIGWEGDKGHQQWEAAQFMLGGKEQRDDRCITRKVQGRDQMVGRQDEERANEGVRRGHDAVLPRCGHRFSCSRRFFLIPRTFPLPQN